MKKIFKKKLLYIGLPIVALAFIAGVPIDEDKTLLDQIIAAFPSAEANEQQQEQSRKSLNDVWDEIKKLSDHNQGDSIMMSGKVRLFDNYNEEGVSEQQNFIMKQAGLNQWFHLDSFDRIQLDRTFFMIDHLQKEITIQQPNAVDSILNAVRLMDPEKVKEMLIKDGTIAEVTESGNEKTLTIKPGLIDAVNRYDLVYDKTTYQIRKFRLYYTSIPYQEYIETSPDKNSKELNENNREENTNNDEEELELNITEYVMELDIQTSENSCDMNFLDNKFYRIKDGEIVFAGKLANYKKSSF